MFEQREIRAFARGGEKNRRRIDGSQIESVPIAMIVALAGHEFFMPGREFVVENKIEFEMQVCALPRNAFARVGAAAHRGDALALFDWLAGGEAFGDLAQMRIERADFQ